MVLKIRLARFGKRHAPFYNIVVAHARTARNSKPLEVLGTYDPIPKTPSGGEGRKFKDIKLDTARAKYWLGVGAQPTDTAWRLMSMLGLLEPRYRIGQLQNKSGSAPTTSERPSNPPEQRTTASPA
ncbi:37S ribosomal protein S16, mitochondrial [Elasticomyces elasticus]|nr:37S ribosomal protein S16, mitochondrial [Elasticomyces elasticus]